MRSYLLIGLIHATFTSAAPAFAFGKKPIPLPAPSPKPSQPLPDPAPIIQSTCPAAGEYQAVDLSEPSTQKFLDVMKQIGVRTVIRYYDQTNETLDGKTLHADETDLLARNGFDVMVVFQHNNNSISTFTSARGTSDANRSLTLAGENRQPKGSAIYFGVDGDWSATADQNRIKTYFAAAAPLVRKAGFKVGAYGSGLTCTQLLASGLVDYCWLANATSWPQYQSFLGTQNWTMVQHLPTDCGGINVDFDAMNAKMRDVGQFRP